MVLSDRLGVVQSAVWDYFYVVAGLCAQLPVYRCTNHASIFPATVAQQASSDPCHCPGLWSGTDGRILSLFFLLPPALIAPFIGGYLLKFLGWRSIFWLLGGYGVLTLALAWFALPETLPKERRQATSFGQIIPQYLLVFRHRQNMCMLCGGFSFAGMFAQLSGTPLSISRFLGLHPNIMD